MVLSTTPKLTFSTLPPDLLDVYVRYKKTTHNLLTWILQHSPMPEKSARSLKLKELEHLAREATKKISSIPDVVHFYFRETIADRTRLSKYFRTQLEESRNDHATVHHEHFTAMLAKIYSNMCTSCAPSNLQAVQHQEQQSRMTSQLSNYYDGLIVEENEELEQKEADHETSTVEPALLAFTKFTGSDPKSDFRLADDDLGNALEIAAAVQQIVEITSSVNFYSRLTAKGTISFPILSFIANVALASMRQVAENLLQFNDGLTVSDLHSPAPSLNGPIEHATQKQKETNVNQNVLILLQYIEGLLWNYEEETMDVCAYGCPNCGHKFAKEFHSRVTNGKAGTKSFSKALIRNIIQLAEFEVIPYDIFKSGTPIYSDIDKIGTNQDHPAESWSAILGLNILTQSYAVFLRSLKQPKMISQSRISALKLAQQVSSELTPILKDSISCRCDQTLGYRLQCMQIELKWYASHNCWDLIFQSPWVAGSHVLEILDRCHYYGMYLLKYRYYVGAVLHSYNVLTQLGGLDKIPVLEKISIQFRDTLFPGGTTPKNNFYARWARYAGARLKFDHGHKGKSTHDTWCLAIPAHAAKTAHGLDVPGRRHKDNDECLLFQIKAQDYHITETQWKELRTSFHLLQGNRKENEDSLTSSTRATAMSSPSRSQQLLPLVVAIEKTLIGSVDEPLPMARLNIFALFQKCVHVVGEIADRMPCKEDITTAINCICFCTAITDGADRIYNGRRVGQMDAWTKLERKVIEDTKAAIEKGFGSVKEADLLWDV